jgi:hypothetical protein
MKRKQFALFVFFVFLFILFLPKEAESADFYEHCLMPNGFGTGNDSANSLILSPLNRENVRHFLENSNHIKYLTLVVFMPKLSL